jgi:alkaline phosphatase D
VTVRIDRRTFLAGASAFLAPALIRAQGAVPQMPQGVAVGDVAAGRAVVWSRADRAARMFVEYATTERFKDARRVPGPSALEACDFTARTVLTGLPEGQRIFYRVLFQDLADIRQWSEPVGGSFTTGAAGCLFGGHRWPGLGHQSRMGRPASVRNDAARATRRVHSPR